MSFSSFLEPKLIKFAKSENAAAIVAMGIAAAKGVFRPIFTMMDKHENPETKRYTATREFLTELIAIPVYFTSGVVAKRIAEKLANPKYFIKKAGTQEMAEKLAKENLPKLKSTVGLISVCISALFLIPGICSATIKPLMNKMSPKNNKTDLNKNNQTQNLANPITKPANYNIYKNAQSTCMKVGGL